MMNAFDILSVFSSTRHSIFGYAMSGLLFCLTVCWLSSIAMESSRYEPGKP